jgi:hypothetical protein
VTEPSFVLVAINDLSPVRAMADESKLVTCLLACFGKAVMAEETMDVFVFFRFLLLGF